MHALETTVDLPLVEAESAVRDALAGQGFGVLTEIDVAATLKAKLDVDREPLKILGACNPGFADRALSPAPGGGTLVRIADPRSIIDDPAFTELADSAANQLQAALDALG